MRVFLLTLTVALVLGGLVYLVFASTAAAVICAVYLAIVVPLAVLVGRAIKRSGPPSSD
ncbi:hypothetical protein [Streptomyces sp. NBC_00691]|uniref:hypothetical protein n=1 Tax=Streptomyces sp. NBC_00691 TaxID=2903671 RepID=UPI002E301A3A|nr:hypothetical protein [Streptomyces sp. NBC_00691]